MDKKAEYKVRIKDILKDERPRERLTRDYNNLLERIAGILASARTKVVREINRTQVLAYWEIGREVVEFEQKGKTRAEYGEEIVKRLSRDMTEKFGRGFSPTNLKMMRLFYQSFPIRQTVSDEFFGGRKFQMLSGKSETSFRKSVEFQKQQALSAKFEPMLSWSHYCELLKIDEPLTAAPQSIIQISHEKYLMIKKRGEIDERFTVS